MDSKKKKNQTKKLEREYICVESSVFGKWLSVPEEKCMCSLPQEPCTKGLGDKERKSSGSTEPCSLPEQAALEKRGSGEATLSGQPTALGAWPPLWVPTAGYRVIWNLSEMVSPSTWSCSIWVYLFVLAASPVEVIYPLTAWTWEARKGLHSSPLQNSLGSLPNPTIPALCHQPICCRPVC